MNDTNRRDRNFSTLRGFSPVQHFLRLPGLDSGFSKYDGVYRVIEDILIKQNLRTHLLLVEQFLLTNSALYSGFQALVALALPMLIAVFSIEKELSQ